MSNPRVVLSEGSPAYYTILPCQKCSNHLWQLWIWNNSQTEVLVKIPLCAWCGVVFNGWDDPMREDDRKILIQAEYKYGTDLHKIKIMATTLGAR